MKEKILKDYLDGKVSVDIFAADVKDSQKKTSHDVVSVTIDKIDEVGEFEIKREHLIKLLDDTIARRLTATDLNTIFFCFNQLRIFYLERKRRSD